MPGKINAILTMWLSSALAPKADPQSGKQIVLQGNKSGAIACTLCHDLKGEGQSAAGVPQLSGLDSLYILKQLQDYASHKRTNAVMQPIASALSDQEKRDVASYLAGLAPESVPTQTASEAQSGLGLQIAETGLWAKGVPACFACHGPEGLGVGSNFPRITLQYKTYIIQQLTAWKTGERRNDPNNLMKSIADKLSPDEINAVASYLSSVEIKSAKGDRK